MYIYIYIYVHIHISLFCVYIDNQRFKDTVSCTIACCSQIGVPCLYIVVDFFALDVGKYYPVNTQA